MLLAALGADAGPETGLVRRDSTEPPSTAALRQAGDLALDLVEQAEAEAAANAAPAEPLDASETPVAGGV